jgi:Flp pilus assembly secretin CpaC|tara:strand:+ start:1496 stop:1819 length:324 start_codon:yes stop_codon:yes gene_type:complete
MAVISLTVKKIISRVRQAFPDAPETYIINLINESLVEMGKYNTKVEYAKLTTVANQQWYTLKEQVGSTQNSNVEINKVYRVDFMDSDGTYVKIPRLLDNEIPTMDID